VKAAQRKFEKKQKEIQADFEKSQRSLKRNDEKLLKQRNEEEKKNSDMKKKRDTETYVDANVLKAAKTSNAVEVVVVDTFEEDVKEQVRQREIYQRKVQDEADKQVAVGAAAAAAAGTGDVSHLQKKRDATSAEVQARDDTKDKQRRAMMQLMLDGAEQSKQIALLEMQNSHFKENERKKKEQDMLNDFF
jgi:hypothetical protein